MTTTALPLFVEDDVHELDALTTRAVRLALRPELAVDDAAAELVAAAGGDRRQMSAAIARVDRALAAEWSNVGARAAAELRAALVQLERT